jgi:hypothetical protein
MYTEKIVITIKAKTVIKVVVSIYATRLVCAAVAKAVTPSIQRFTEKLRETTPV